MLSSLSLEAPLSNFSSPFFSEDNLKKVNLRDHRVVKNDCLDRSLLESQKSLSFLDYFLMQMEYQPGPLIDARQTKSLLFFEICHIQQLSKNLLQAIRSYVKSGGALVVSLADLHRAEFFRYCSHQRFPISKDFFSRIAIVGTYTNELIKFSGEMIDLQNPIHHYFQEMSRLNEGESELKICEIFRAVIQKAHLHPLLPLFETPLVYTTLAESRLEAQRLIEEILRLSGGRESVNQYIAELDRRNGPVHYRIEIINAYTEAFTKSVKNCEQIALDYKGLQKLNQGFLQELEKQQINPESLGNNFHAAQDSFEDLMQASLEQMHLEAGSIVRFLEPGNNDQTTPLFLAYQIALTLQYARQRQIQINIQVLIMGLGGHATTAIFPQIGEIREGEFFGTPEALSLGETLSNALSEKDIAFEFVENFCPELSGRVQIKLAQNSKHTGENVAEALNCNLPGAKVPHHLFIAAARPANLRQTLTFAKKLSCEITAIPYLRSKRFVEQGLDDAQAVTEMMIGLAEECRLLLYGFNLENPFIPASPINLEQLNRLYENYDRFSKTDAPELSKQKTIKELFDFFLEKTKILEKAITPSYERERQTLATKRTVEGLLKKMELKEAFSSSYHDFLVAKKFSNRLDYSQSKWIKRFEQLLNNVQSAQNDTDKFIYYRIMACFASKMREIIQTHEQALSFL